MDKINSRAHMGSFVASSYWWPSGFRANTALISCYYSQSFTFNSTSTVQRLCVEIVDHERFKWFSQNTTVNSYRFDRLTINKGNGRNYTIRCIAFYLLPPVRLCKLLRSANRPPLPPDIRRWHEMNIFFFFLNKYWISNRVQYYTSRARYPTRTIIFYS